jgi:glyceraldehyde 3-phosphate dehydrogenase
MDTPTLAHLFTYDSVHGTHRRGGEPGGGRHPGGGETGGRHGREGPGPPALERNGRGHRGRMHRPVYGTRTAPGHLDAGARKVVISAPAKGPDATIVMGVNDSQYDPAPPHRLQRLLHHQLSGPGGQGPAGEFRHRHGLMTTIHAYTGDQRCWIFPTRICAGPGPPPCP